jgi:hypothetical protein
VTHGWYPRQCSAYVVNLGELLRYAGQAGVLGNNGVRQRTQSEKQCFFLLLFGYISGNFVN